MVHDCPSFLSITVISTMTERNLGENGLFHLQFFSLTVVHQERKLGQELKTGPWKQKLKQNLGRNVASCLSLDGLHSLISDTTQDYLATFSHSFSDLGLSISLVNWSIKKCFSDLSTIQVMEDCSQLRLPLPR